jgi:hypothetical protein
MRSPLPDTPEAAVLREWLEETVLADYGYDTAHIGEALLLFESDYSGSFLTALLDGLPAERPEWAGPTQPPSRVFFRGLSAYLADTPSHIAQLLGHDGAYWEVRQVARMTSELRYLPWILTLLHREPADEAGATYIMLLADDRRSAVVLADCPYITPPYRTRFCIAFHGDSERRAAFLSHLRQAASSTEAILL